jgi:hypothetical protein
VAIDTSCISRALSLFCDCINSFLSSFNENLSDKKVYDVLVCYIIVMPHTKSKRVRHNDRILYYLQDDSKVSITNVLWRACIFLLVVILYLKCGAKLNDFERRILQTFLLFFPVYILFSNVQIVAAQLSLYPFFLYCFVTQILYDGIRSKFNKSLFLGFILFSSMVYFYSMLNFTLSASEGNFSRSERIKDLKM